MPSIIYSAQNIGLEADIVDVEVDVTKGFRSFVIIGLADKAVDEAKDRINSAIKNSGFRPPARGNKRIIISLAPGNIQKHGTHFDLAIALGYLAASKQLTLDGTDKLFLGELSLDGRLRSITGVLPLVQAAKAQGFKEIFVPTDNAWEAALVKGLSVFPCQSLKQITEHWQSKTDTGGQSIKSIIKINPPREITGKAKPAGIDFADIKGQDAAKRGLEIAVAGGHNIALTGPPGTGKTLLAKALAGILPPLSFDQVVAITGIHSVAGRLRQIITDPPFRSPHHTASYAAIIGGGSWPKPGEITLAHGGVLFLDEFPEFDKRVIEALRGPLEDRLATVSRVKHSFTFPANFILVAAMNPCPCGYRDSDRECVCTPVQLAGYLRKLSGPIIDRIDMWLPVPAVRPTELSADSQSESSAEKRKRVIIARQIQEKRFRQSQATTNAEMDLKEMKKYTTLKPAGRQMFDQAALRLGLSARAYHRVLRLARTIADLEQTENIEEKHLWEALQYRPKNH
ncbi:MAG: YifB family Mg chelatase-like AAA ATPase [Candidatus Paceibacterota bacterium]